MHPAISAFPRHIFYGGLLRDGKSVRALSEPFHDRFPPFIFLDMPPLGGGGGGGGSGGGSGPGSSVRCNPAEAALVLRCYECLRDR